LNIDNKTVEKHRPPKELLDAEKPYFFLNEEEIQDDGRLHSVNTIFLTNKECPFKCVMCDLWRHTLDEPTPDGAIPKQIKFALERLPQASVVKLYNSGNFFDGAAIPRKDYQKIAELLSNYQHVIVENHPKLIGPFITEFKEMLNGSFEIAMGLESIHPEVMPKLNKQITKENFQKASKVLIDNGISLRAFILLNPPFLKGVEENKKWCLKSVEFAFDTGASACSIIPTRDGNGIMEKLKDKGDFELPTLNSLEEVFDEALKLGRGRVFCDVWDLQKFTECSKCFDERKTRLDAMNKSQTVLPKINCECRNNKNRSER
jgi:archaeosine synthase beta-subunit